MRIYLLFTGVATKVFTSMRYNAHEKFLLFIYVPVFIILLQILMPQKLIRQKFLPGIFLLQDCRC